MTCRHRSGFILSFSKSAQVRPTPAVCATETTGLRPRQPGSEAQQSSLVTALLLGLDFTARDKISQHEPQNPSKDTPWPSAQPPWPSPSIWKRSGKSSGRKHAPRIEFRLLRLLSPRPGVRESSRAGPRCGHRGRPPGLPRSQRWQSLRAVPSFLCLPGKAQKTRAPLVIPGPLPKNLKKNEKDS